MQRSVLIGVVLAAAVAGIGLGYLLGVDPAPPPPIAPVAAGAAPKEGTNAIAALATSKSGGPVTPKPGLGVGALDHALVNYVVAYDGAADKAIPACAQKALGEAIAGLSTDPGTATLESSPCGGSGATRSEGRVRVATSAAKSIAAGSEAATRCEVTVRFSVPNDKGAMQGKELKADATDADGAAACATAGEAAIAELTERLAG